MEVQALKIHGCYLLTPVYYEDERGGFYEAFNHQEFEKGTGHTVNFVQDNLSISKKGTLRGLHFQNAPYAQAKYLRVVQGAVLDVVVDLRKDSPTYREHMKIRLEAKTHQALFIPKGIAHGFLALEEATQFLYKCDSYYHPDSEGGINYRDPELAIDWEYPENKMIISPKDRNLPMLKDTSL